jgi:hypothetical protein
MSRWLVVLASVMGVSGCTTFSLTQHTLAQVGTAADLRYHEVLDNLAMVAADPSALPVYSSIYAGSASVTDNAQVMSTTIWQHVVGASGFASEAANPQATRTVLENWTLDPIAVPEKLEALRCSCRWVLFGPDHACDDSPGILDTPEQSPTPGRHFGVSDRLAALPAGWLHVGRLTDVPLGASYKAHAGGTWVWVMPDGLGALSDFSLVFQDIARVNSNSPTLFVPRPLPSVFTIQTGFTRSPEGKDVPVLATVSVDPLLNLVPDTPYFRYRLDTVGSNAFLRSQISATGGH